MNVLLSRLPFFYSPQRTRFTRAGVIRQSQTINRSGRHMTSEKPLRSFRVLPVEDEEEHTPMLSDRLPMLYRDSGTRLGAYACLEKPVDIGRLTGALHGIRKQEKAE
jgi:hypothetical protein